MGKKKVPFGVDLPEEVLQRFNEFAAAKGYVKWKATAGALDLFRCLSPDLRELLIEGHAERVKARIEEAFAAKLELELQKSLSDARSRSERQPAPDDQARGKG